MQTIYHQNESRGKADFGWLKSRHTFSFGEYHNPERVNFGVLRVINDDYVKGGEGFGTHPHRDMEIISIPLSGDLAHKDSIGNGSVIREGDIQVMSAGTGITHSEMNANENEAVKFLQIWVMSKKRGVEPRYQQISLKDIVKPNELSQVLSPNADDAGVWVHQDAWFFLGKFDSPKTVTHTLKDKGNGAYIFVIEGKAKVGDKELDTRDGLGVWDVESFDIEIEANSRILVMEVPMDVNAHTNQ